LLCTLLHSTLQELNNFYPVLTSTQFMAAQIHNFQILPHLFYFSFQSLCGALGDASRSTNLCSALHSLGISALQHLFRFFLPSLASFFLLNVDAEGPCCNRAHLITHTHTHTQTVGKVHLDEESALRRGFYLTTHTNHNRQTSLSPGGNLTRNPSN